MNNLHISKKTAILAASSIISILLANFVCFIYFPHTRLGLDWDFESYSLLIRSTILHYHKFPMHDPFVAGGVDILANPQNRVFSPSILLELVFNPTYVYFSSIILWGIVGYLGFYKLLKFYKVSDKSSIIFPTIFLCSSYFGLHFAEGHISFASLQAIGLIFYLILNIDKIKYLFFYSLLMTVLLLEGHIHVLIFSQIVLSICLLFNMNGIATGIIRNFRKYLPQMLIMALIFAMIASIKLVPVLVLFAKRAPVLDYENISLYLILRIFFDPFQHVVKDTHMLIHPFLTARSRFHEYGCYIGIVTFIILLKHFFNKQFLKENLKTVSLAVFFFWVGSGWFEIVNPWKLFMHIPLFNNFHVASRLFIVVSMLCLIMLAKIFDGWRDKPLRYWGLIAFLLVEVFFVRNYPFYKLFNMMETRPHLTALIMSDNIERTVHFGRIPYHYYKHNTGAETTYEPAKIVTPVLNSSDINYRGEIHRCDKKAPEAKTLSITRYIPGEIHIRYDMESPGCIELNTNNLLGWKVVEGEANVISDSGRQLLTLDTKNAAGEVVIKYRPFYLYWTLSLFILGIVLAVLYWKYIISGKYAQNN